MKNVVVGFVIKDYFGQPLFGGDTRYLNITFDKIQSDGYFSCKIDNIPLLPDKYVVHLFCSVDGEVSDRITNAGILYIENNDFLGTGKNVLSSKHGIMYLKQQWNLCENYKVS